MKMKNGKRILLMLFIMVYALVITACSAGSAGSPAVKKYTWDDAEFTVKEITDDESVIGDKADQMSGKCVAVTIDFGEDTISQSSFEGNVAKGMFLLAGNKPATYNYHMANMTFDGADFEPQITGETTIFFDMDKDYEIKEEDLLIKE